jgi:hypothetical protein
MMVVGGAEGEAGGRVAESSKLKPAEVPSSILQNEKFINTFLQGRSRLNFEVEIPCQTTSVLKTFTTT